MRPLALSKEPFANQSSLQPTLFRWSHRTIEWHSCSIFFTGEEQKSRYVGSMYEQQDLDDCSNMRVTQGRPLSRLLYPATHHKFFEKRHPFRMLLTCDTKNKSDLPYHNNLISLLAGAPCDFTFGASFLFMICTTTTRNKIMMSADRSLLRPNREFNKEQKE